MEMDIDYDMPDLVADANDWTGTYTWRVENWTGLTETKINSPVFEVGGYSWKLVVYPRGKNSQIAADNVSVYLKCSDAFLPQHTWPTAKFELVVLKINDLAESLKREARYELSCRETDWGFRHFLSCQEVQNPHNGYLVNDTLTLRVNIKIDDHDPGMTSKLKTGFVGIKHPEKTSLLNSFLQCFFHVKVLRKAVFQMPTVETDDPQNSLPLALQQLFYLLQYQNMTVKTKELIEALDWTCIVTKFQHNVTEIKCTLFDKLGKADKASGVKDCILELFKGEYTEYTETPRIKEIKTSRQSFMEITFDILEGKDIYTSLERFCLLDTFEEDNDRRKIRPALAESKHYTLFDSLPTVLQFNLKRCYYNRNRGVLLKINSPYEFHDELDLDYNDRILMSKNTDQMVENKYKLQSVMVHTDDSDGGRYYAYIRHDEEWFKFDGEVVTAVSAEKAINMQFGDESGSVSANFSKGFDSTTKSAAVVLFYIRKSEWHRVMCDVEQNFLPKQIQTSFEKQRMVKEKRHQEKTKAHLFLNIRLAAEVHFAEQVIRENYRFDSPRFGNIKHYRIHKKALFEDFKEMVSRDYGIPKHLQRFWGWMLKDNYHIEIYMPINNEECRLKTVLDLMLLPSFDIPPEFDKIAIKTINLFLESPQTGHPGTEGVLHTMQADEIMVFVMYYDPVLMEISYLGHLFIGSACQIHLVLEKAKKMAGLASEEEVLGFGEVKDSPAFFCTELEPEASLKETQLSLGDIIIIQKAAANSQYKYPTVQGFLEFIQNSTKVTFRPLEKPKDEGFKLDLLKKISYEQVTTELAKHLEVDDPKKLRLTRHDNYAHTPESDPIKYNGIESLEKMTLNGYRYSHILYYEVLDIQLPYLETSKCVKILFLNRKGEVQSEHELRIQKRQKVSDLAEAVKVELGEDYKNCDIRIMHYHFSKVYKILDPEEIVEQAIMSIPYLAEVILEDQKNLASDEFLTIFCKCKLDDDGDVTWIDSPLLVKVKKGEVVREVKVRVQQRLEISDEDFSRWRIAFQAHRMHPVEYLRDEDEILAIFPNVPMNQGTNRKIIGNDDTFIALVHEDTKLNH